MRRLREDCDDLGGEIVAQRFEAEVHHAAAHVLLEVAAARAERLRDTAAQAVDEHGDLLQARARRADQPDVASAHNVGESERAAVDDGRAAVGPHHEQALLQRAVLQGYLVLERDVVGEEHDVQARIEGLLGLRARVASGHGDHGEVDARVLPERAVQRMRCGFPISRPLLGGEEPLELGDRLPSCLLAVGTHADDDVVGTELPAAVGEKPACADDRVVAVGAHEHHGLVDAGERLHHGGPQHQGDRVVVRVPPNLGDDGHGTPPSGELRLRGEART